MSLPGRLIYNLWHRPIAAVRHSIRHGGPLRQWETRRGEAAMRIAAAKLPPLPARPGAPLVVHLLTGRRFVHQSAFCLRSLALACPAPVHAEIYDDGSLDPEVLAQLRRLGPQVSIHAHADLRERLDRFLPPDRFPVLRERWQNYPHLRKVIDVHLGRRGWRLVLDSDLLFWREPVFLLNWHAAPDRPLHGIDCVENYGYPRTLLERVAGCKLPARVNVGLCGLQSEAIDWDFLEWAAAKLIAAGRYSYYLEQALVALLVARAAGAAAAPFEEYITLPSAAEIARPTAVMHHYVDTSRGPYLRRAWQAFA